QTRPLALPPADAEVDVVALRKDPCVAAGHDAELEDQPPPVPNVERSVSLERDAVTMIATQPERPRGDPVHSVGADDRACANALPVDEHVAVVERDRDAVAELGAGLGCPLREELVQPSPLREQAERRLAPAHERRPVVEAKLEA